MSIEAINSFRARWKAGISSNAQLNRLKIYMVDMFRILYLELGLSSKAQVKLGYFGLVKFFSLMAKLNWLNYVRLVIFNIYGKLGEVRLVYIQWLN